MRFGRLSRTQIIALSTVAAVLLVSFSAAVAVVLRMQPLGLHAQYYRGLHGSAAPMLVTSEPILTTIEELPLAAIIKSSRAQVPAELFSAVWEA